MSSLDKEEVERKIDKILLKKIHKDGDCLVKLKFKGEIKVKFTVLLSRLRDKKLRKQFVTSITRKHRKLKPMYKTHRSNFYTKLMKIRVALDNTKYESIVVTPPKEIDKNSIQYAVEFYKDWTDNLLKCLDREEKLNAGNKALISIFCKKKSLDLLNSIEVPYKILHLS